jgi:hypothetical protein
MTCREFTRTVEGFSLAELSRVANAELLQHGQGCVDCAGWFQRRHALAGAMQTLRSSTAAMEAPVDVERAVLRALRQSSVAAVVPREALPQPLAFRLSNFFGWGAYAAVAAALAISLGLGIWFLQHSGKASRQAAQLPTAKTEQLVQSKATQPEQVAQSPQPQAPAYKKSIEPTVTRAAVVLPGKTAASTASLAQTAQAQGYTPLMLCDPLSCSGDEQIVRLELPATAADGSVESQMADVVVGDDGLVRAIRIVQQ